MKRTVNISVLILLYLLLTAKSCTNREEADAAREEAIFKATKDSISSVFISDTLSDQTLKAFEATARIKLLDLGDYLKILADSTTDKGFKTRVKDIVSKMFISEDQNHRRINSRGIFQVLPGGVHFDSVKVQKPFERINDSLYSGKLRFLVNYPNSAKIIRNGSPKLEKTIDVYLVKREKVFGRNSMKVWTVLFGDIQ